jgi:beta-galactosidase/beta-glucuronidase
MLGPGNGTRTVPGRTTPLLASTQDGSYPRPQLCREQWLSLDGTWDFAYDDDDLGLAEHWFDPSGEHVFPDSIEVPLPPESPASGIGRREFHPVVWYHRSVHTDALTSGGSEGQRVLIHFGAVDHSARVWLDGQLVATHEGGQTPFTADVTDALTPGRGEHQLVVRAEDDPTDPDQVRGKQDWREKTRGIWYERTTGIWQPVWAECVEPDHLAELAWTPDIAAGVVHGQITLARRPGRSMTVEVTVRLGDEVLAEQATLARDRSVGVDLRLDALRNGQDRARLLWAPEHPTLLDLEVRLRDRESGTVLDMVTSYTGLRTVSVEQGAFRLNDQPYYVRSVLNQGYRPETHLAARSTDELRAEVETIKQMGFNSVRIHQKAEDPRWLYWADRLGLMVWGESASAYGFSASAVTAFVTEWTDLVRRDRSHPCIAVWVPVNESWGVQDIAVSPAQQSYARALAELTRALDPSRPVVSNEGWEHVDSDIFGLHDYTDDADVLRRRYATRQAVTDLVRTGRTPHGRRPLLGESQARALAAGETPLMITEFGGVSLLADGAAEDTWGYSNAGSGKEYADLLMGLFDALRASEEVTGFCYTQYMDTGQETNGLLFKDGTPKIPMEAIREVVTGETGESSSVATSTVGWTE